MEGKARPETADLQKLIFFTSALKLVAGKLLKMFVVVKHSNLTAMGQLVSL